MSILVTGGAGFIGSHFIERLLATGDEPVVCLDNFDAFYDPARKRANVASFAAGDLFRLVECDICDTDQVRRALAEHEVRAVVHLAAHAGVRRSVEEPGPYARVNVSGTLSLLEAARQHRLERFVLVSSSTVYGRGAAVPFVEDAPLGLPMSPYGATKRAAELLGLTYLDLHQVPVVVLRPFSIYGPRLRPDLALSIFADAILSGRALPLFGDGSIRRDFTHVSDFCAAVCRAIEAQQAIGEAINVGHHDPIAMSRLIELLAESLGREANIERLPEKPGDMPVTWADLTKARRLLDYDPQVPFADGVREFAEWFKAQ